MQQRAPSWHAMIISTALVGATAVGAQSPDFTWHTSPDLWDEPRSFHTEAWAERDAYIRLERVELGAAPVAAAKEGKLSPNEVYWAAPGERVERTYGPGEGCDFRRDCTYEETVWNVDLFVFTERPYLLRLAIRDFYPNFGYRYKWINEKLLFVQVWWGRIVGDDLILDVEKEEIIYREAVNDGVLPFIQFTRQREGRKNPQD